MPAPLLDGRPGVYLALPGHPVGTYFVDDPHVLAFWAARGFEPADEPPEDDEEPKKAPKDSPESPAAKKTSKKAAAAAEKE
jgi:hypothetical protein